MSSNIAHNANRIGGVSTTQLMYQWYDMRCDDCHVARRAVVCRNTHYDVYYHTITCRAVARLNTQLINDTHCLPTIHVDVCSHY